MNDYSMSGEHSTVAESASQLIDADKRVAFKKLLHVILEHRLVSLQGPSDTWKVKAGSGMGLMCSGEVSDATFQLNAWAR